MKKLLIICLVLIIAIPFTYGYELTSVDIKVINSLNNKVDTKSDSFKIEFSNYLSNLIDSGKYSDRIESILDEIVNNISVKDESDTTISDTEIEGNLDNEIINSSSEDLIDRNIVKYQWLDWNNELRKNLGLNEYLYDNTLENSAKTWSDQAKEKGEISHKRNEGDSFYNYTEINSWLAKNGVSCENVSGITHTENIWWGGYSCTDGECSDELIEATKRAFDYYVAEKGTDSDAHYRSLTNSYFNNIGLGFSIDNKGNNYYEYYLTIHYCTNLIK